MLLRFHGFIFGCFYNISARNVFVTSVLELEEKEVCYSMRMALIPRFAFFVLLLLPCNCKAEAENCRETQCRLLPVEGDEVASDFRLKASKEGVRLVYINLTVIRNSSYHPLGLKDGFRLFLPHRWIWAHTVREPMLSLPEDYAFLSASLLTYEVKSIDVKLKDQPNGCLAKLNSTCQNLAVGRMLLQNVTSSISSDILHQNTPVVCVTVMDSTRFGANMWHRCCYVHNEATGPATIRCNKRIDVDDWVKIVNSIFFFLSFFLALFAPALPLALPDYVISLEDEVEKENHPAEQTNMETTGYQRITNPATVGQQDDQRGIGADRSNMEDVTAINVPMNTIQEETGQNTSNFVGNSLNKGMEREFIPVDDSSPMILSTLLRESVKKFPDVPLSFNVKLAVMSFCVYPCVLYVQIGLFHTLKKTYIDELTKHYVPADSLALFNLLLNPYDIIFGLYMSMPMIIMSIVVVLFSRPKDFILEENEVCQLCHRMSTICSSLNLSLTARRSLGDEIHRHLRIFHQLVWYALLRYGNILASICHNLLLGCLREEMYQESRGRHLLCVCFRFISLIGALPFIIVGGILCLLILIVVLIVPLFLLSPFTTVYLFIWNKIIVKRLLVNCRGLTAFCGWLYFLSVLGMGICFSLTLLRISCLFVSSFVSYIIIALALNATIVTPFLAFFLVLTTNVYSCYSKMQGKYKEVKKMIWTRLQELQLNNNVPKDTIRAEIYWFVCDKVLPVKSEMCRMLRNMVLVVAFLFLALSSIVFYGNKYDISTLTTTISVFFTGSIPLLFSKVLSTNSNIIGWAKIKMEGEIDKAITEYRDSSN
ncbi:PREDICTED: uncharacterized protein LOC107348600 [Acropora digitifera]|uniref:uncharacterized protein LOC107348600 n=1 Tax=Acropora digitifera TaxID=70779 RepID=UPI00077AFD17|nr:PREDICTED: uncharacterized protein LOC107348600 [Acropora digitifera]